MQIYTNADVCACVYVVSLGTDDKLGLIPSSRVMKMQPEKSGPDAPFSHLGISKKWNRWIKITLLLLASRYWH